MIEGKTIFITGGAGFIGSTLVGRLVEHNRIVLYDNLARNSLQGQAVQGPPQPDADRRATCWTIEHCAQAMEGADIVVHCAAIAGIDTVIKSPVTTMRVNMVGSANVLEAASKLPHCDRVVCFSTSEVFGQQAFRSVETDKTVDGQGGRGALDLRRQQAGRGAPGDRLLPGAVAADHRACGRSTSTAPARWARARCAPSSSARCKNETIEIHGDGTQIRAWCYVDDMVGRRAAGAWSIPRPSASRSTSATRRAVVTIYGLANTVIRVLGSRTPDRLHPQGLRRRGAAHPVRAQGPRPARLRGEGGPGRGHPPHRGVLPEPGPMIRLAIPSIEEDDLAGRARGCCSRASWCRGRGSPPFEQAVADYVGTRTRWP